MTESDFGQNSENLKQKKEGNGHISKKCGHSLPKIGLKASKLETILSENGQKETTI